MKRSLKFEMFAGITAAILLTQTIHDAEDILQTVFYKIYKGIEQLEDQAAIKPWIYRIAKNTIINFNIHRIIPFLQQSAWIYSVIPLRRL